MRGLAGGTCRRGARERCTGGAHAGRKSRGGRGGDEAEGRGVAGPRRGGARGETVCVCVFVCVFVCDHIIYTYIDKYIHICI